MSRPFLSAARKDPLPTPPPEKEKEKPAEKAEVKDTKTLLDILKENPWYETVYNWATWKSPFKSALIFIFVGLVYFLTRKGKYNLITLTCYLGLAMISVCSALVNFMIWKNALMQQPPPENFVEKRLKDKKFQLTQQQFGSHIDTALQVINLGIESFRQAVFCTNQWYTLRVVIALYVVSLVARIFSVYTLMYIGFVLLFIVPKVYLSKQEKIDYVVGFVKAKLALVTAKAEEYWELGLSKLPPEVASRLPWKAKEGAKKE